MAMKDFREVWLSLFCGIFKKIVVFLLPKRWNNFWTIFLVPPFPTHFHWTNTQKRCIILCQLWCNIYEFLSTFYPCFNRDISEKLPSTHFHRDGLVCNKLHSCHISRAMAHFQKVTFCEPFPKPWLSHRSKHRCHVNWQLRQLTCFHFHLVTPSFTQDFYGSSVLPPSNWILKSVIHPCASKRVKLTILL